MMVWPSNQSFTKQPSIEFHTFGSTPVLEIAVQTFCESGARPAMPGEFTMRAFLSGRIDLTQAEAVLAVIDAKNQRQLNVAMGQLAGGVGSQLDATRNELIAALAELEAGLDFVEEDITFISNDAMVEKLHSANRSIKTLLDQISSRDSKTASFRVSLFGLPNAGKSSLFNSLLGRDVAIVANISGTTTDRVSATWKPAGMRVELVDTAGLETIDADDSIAFASQQQRKSELDQCDLAVLCVDANQSQQETLWQIQQHNSDSLILTLTQCDRSTSAATQTLSEAIRNQHPDLKIIATSSIDGTGLSLLTDAICEFLAQSQTEESAIVGSTLLRTGESLREAETSISSAAQAAIDGIGDEVVAAEVRLALDSIGLVVGKIYTDDILDVVFGKFCIGK
jgi:tRNA modification GTPase